MDETHPRRLPERVPAVPRAGRPVDDPDMVTGGDTDTRRLSITQGDVLLPCTVIHRAALEQNVRLMQRYADAHGALLAPHAKTTLAPAILRLLIDAGAWGITVANVAQGHIAIQAGARHVLVANEVVGVQDAVWLAQQAESGAVDIVVQTDSPAAVALLDRRLSAAGIAGWQPVLVEVGHQGGRAGGRDAAGITATVDAIRASRHLALAGVSTYEGVVGHDRSPETLDLVDRYLDAFLETVRRVAAAHGPSERPLLVSAGGTRFVDRVVERIGSRRRSGDDFDLVIRPGCYVTFGHVTSADASPFSAEGDEGSLEPALEVWAEVLSVPEPDLVIAAVGKRDVGDRADALIPLRVARHGRPPQGVSEGMTVSGLDDQHAYVRPGATVLEVGDRIGFGLRHPTTLGPGRVLPVVDDDDRIIDFIETALG